MITAVDTNILLDIFLPDPLFSKDSLAKLKKCETEGSLIICDLVYAELASAFSGKNLLSMVLKEANIQLRPSNEEALWNAAEIWKGWLKTKKGKKRGERILPDFIIGAHAALFSDQFLTRDRGFYRTCFKNLNIVE
ncbi:MAG: PIN domain-containing protein [Elusimicrobia bacterium]|nr:PIN domain-containing protein [Elusimicrobiota bacterium]